MRRDSERMRGGRPFVFTNLKTHEGLEVVVDFITTAGGLAPVAPGRQASGGNLS